MYTVEGDLLESRFFVSRFTSSWTTQPHFLACYDYQYTWSIGIRIQAHTSTAIMSVVNIYPLLKVSLETGCPIFDECPGEVHSLLSGLGTSQSDNLVWIAIGTAAFFEN
jgi:hypothetical protein